MISALQWLPETGENVKHSLVILHFREGFNSDLSLVFICIFQDEFHLFCGYVKLFLYVWTLLLHICG